jgi:O-succinylbenzoic acid--CoA ligase
MIRLSFHSLAPDLSSLTDDLNLKSAIELINNWYGGADAFTFYSSGSTGIPKEIILTKKFLLASAKRTIELFNISSTDRLLLALNTSFMGGMMMVIRAMVAECELIYIPPSEVNSEIFSQLPSIKLASLVPAQMQALLQENSNTPFLKIENILLGGAPVSNILVRQIIALKSSCSFFHTYGMTETASHVAIRSLKEENSNYQALDGFQFSQDEKECLVIHHIKQPEFTLATNDVIKLTTPTSFQWIGRMDWVVNSGGIKFSLEHAEEVVATFFHEKDLQDAFTSFKCQDEKWGERWVLIVSKEFNQEVFDQLKRYCQKVLGKYIYPKEIRYTKKIVYLSSGKVDRFNTYLQATKLST